MNWSGGGGKGMERYIENVPPYFLSSSLLSYTCSFAPPVLEAMELKHEERSVNEEERRSTLDRVVDWLDEDVR